jgi:uncharacterized protein YchJ
LALKIVEFVEGDKETFVAFEATLSGGKMIEKSRFLKEDGVWYHERGKIVGLDHL